MSKPKEALVKKKTKKPKATKRKAGGGKLSRSEVVQIRLDPKLKFAVDLVARKHRRTLSSLIEWAMDKVANETVVGLKEKESAWHVTNSVWDVDEADRFVNLAYKYPGILTHDEEVLWKSICECFVLWQAPSDTGDEKDFRKNPNKFDLKYLRKGFDFFKQFARGEISEGELVQLFGEIEENDPEYKLMRLRKERQDGTKI